MQRTHSWRWYCFQILLVAAIAATAHWLGYIQGSRSASSRPTTATQDNPTNPDTRRSASRSAAQESGSSQGTANQESQTTTDWAGPEQNHPLANLIDRLAHSHSPAEALAYINSDEIDDREKGPALRALVVEWIASSGELTTEETAQWQNRVNSITGDRFGLEVELGLALAQAPLDPSIAQAWMGTYANHPGRSKLFAGLLAEQFQSDPLLVLGKSSSWTAWEQSQFEQHLFQVWARSSPRAALAWYDQNRDLVGSQIGGEIFDTISQSNPKIASELLSRIQNSDQRSSAIETIATSLARRGTEEAIKWVDSLQDPSERQAAMEAVYHATPQGIGAMMTRKDGFPLIADIIPGGPLESSGLKPGDLIIQAQEAEGEPTDLYGMPMSEFVGALRGEPGSEVEISVLRENPHTSQLEERQVRVTRGVLIIPEREKRTEPEQATP